MNAEVPVLGRDEINDLPLGRYEGDIHIIKKHDELLSVLPQLRDEQVLGFDTETKPTFRKGRYNAPALIQLACSHAVFLIQINKIGFDQQLVELLANASQVKAGVGIRDDIRELSKISQFIPSGLVDLGEVAKKNRLGTHSLRGLAAALLGFRISKTAQCSNWSQSELSQQQIRYAATDAWVSREIYLRFSEQGLLD